MKMIHRDSVVERTTTVGEEVSYESLDARTF